VPRLHGVCEVLPAAAWKPALAGMHCSALLRPTTLLNVPASHSNGVAVPCGQKRPSGHSLGCTVASSAQKKPAAQRPAQLALVCS
jgi:hypothetical protein